MESVQFVEPYSGEPEDPNEEFFPCPNCGNWLPSVEEVLVVAGDYDAPPVYEPEVDTVRCPRCNQEVTPLVL